jgi:hypothetical protein
MSARGQQQRQPQGQPQSRAEQRVAQYLLQNEEISYSLRFRPTGIVNWIKSLFGFGVTHWFVTNQRLIQETRIGGGFTFKDIPHNRISSVEYGSKVSIPAIVLGIVLTLAGLFLLGQTGQVGFIPILLGLALIGYAYWRRQQVLTVKASGGVSIALAISKGQQVDDFLWYLHAEREKQTS